MKILLIGFSKIKYMPYANFYLDNINRRHHNIHFIYWNRDERQEDVSRYADITMHEYCSYQEDDAPKISKLKNFLKYRHFVKKILQEESFDFIIVLHSMPGILLQDILKRDFRERYIFDYRDSTYERFSFYKRMIADIIGKSKATFTSSDGFRMFFPDKYMQKVYTTHNLQMESISQRILNPKPSEKIRLSFWGLIREVCTEKEIIRKIADDDRFELHYYGREHAKVRSLRKYVQQINAQNVFFHGEYNPQQRYDFAENTDLLHNIYCSSNMKLAVSNKYYDGMVFYIPQLCIHDSFMGKMVQDKGIGMACDPWMEDFTERIYRYFSGLDRQSFFIACDQTTEQIVEEYKKAVSIVADCLQENKEGESA